MSPSTSATPTAPGNAAPTRTPTACYASTSRKAPTCHGSPKPTSTPSPTNSTDAPAKPSTGRLPPRNSTSSLHPPLETALTPSGSDSEQRFGDLDDPVVIVDDRDRSPLVEG